MVFSPSSLWNIKNRKLYFLLSLTKNLPFLWRDYLWRGRLTPLTDFPKKITPVNKNCLRKLENIFMLFCVRMSENKKLCPQRETKKGGEQRGEKSDSVSMCAAKLENWAHKKWVSKYSNEWMKWKIFFPLLSLSPERCSTSAFFAPSAKKKAIRTQQQLFNSRARKKHIPGGGRERKQKNNFIEMWSSKNNNNNKPP